MVQTAARLYSADDLLCMRDGDDFELDDGELREVPVGAESDGVAVLLLHHLANHIEGKAAGTLIGSSTGLQIFPGRPRRIPRPDGGFISTARLPGGRLPKGFLTVAPDLVIESISPGDQMAYVNRKIREYLGAGVRVVWVLFPDTRTAEAYRADGTVTYIQEDGALEGEDVLPGFSCPLDKIMPPADAAPAPEATGA
ncbi:MAG: Uma2 family endonuclease [Tepidiformaceae bacterium]